MRDWSDSSVVVAAACAVVACALVGALRETRALEPAGLWAYDALLRRIPPDTTPVPHVAVARITERDLRRAGWPLADSTVEMVARRLASLGARVVAFDVYRERVPPAIAAAGSAIGGTAVVFASKLASARDGGFPCPIGSSEDACGFADAVAARGSPTLRRALYHVQLAGDSAPRASLAYTAVVRYVAPDVLDTSAEPRLGRWRFAPMQGREGDYVRDPIVGHEELLDLHRGAPRVLTFDLDALSRGRVPRAWVAGRMLFVGYDAASIRDEVYLPTTDPDRQPPGEPGAFYHALAASQAADLTLGGGSVLRVRTLPDWGEWIALAAGCALGATLGALLGPLLGMRRTGAWLLLAACASLAPLAVLGAWGALRAGWWLPLVQPLLGWATAAAATTAMLAVAERRAHAAVMQLFSRHVSADVARDIWRRRHEFLDGARPRPRRIPVTVLLADLKGYTSAAEHAPAEQVIAWVSRFTDAMAREIDRHGGIVDDYAGDGIKADFGVPFARATHDEVRDDARRAVGCAVAMAGALERLNSEWLAAGLPVAAMRIGVASGEAAVGSIGSADRLKYTVVGDVVNVASRLESLDVVHDFAALPCRILLDAATHALVRDTVPCEPLGAQPVRGRAQPVEVYRVRAGATVARLPAVPNATVAARTLVVLACLTVSAAAAGAQPRTRAAAESTPPHARADSTTRSAARRATTRATPPATRRIAYMKVGLPPRLIGAGARGCAPRRLPTVVLLAPHDHVAQSATASPVLFWRYAAAPEVAPSDVILVLAGAGRADTARLPVPDGPVVRRVRLADLGYALRPGVTYTLQVRARVGGRTLAGDSVALRIARDVRPRLSGEAAVAAARRLAGGGVWYDAYALLADSASVAPNDDAIAALRDTLERDAERASHHAARPCSEDDAAVDRPRYRAPTSWNAAQ
ncbi:CHASE2 domain protein (plasmid) [Gemmatirosa kalamazoonensis]|uniref:CHASE2 domain protein n=1 Tax=Gemmatirosa kalamazoonensis TaxID=861299 RepID=W0RS98_9BACT|nr:CHASE2 domain-containing protein [Gemmatirosa kalamazoonensis]AHG93332.1 CHASE2 domain protein [Gemmatirosa kalamazoonensis]